MCVNINKYFCISACILVYSFTLMCSLVNFKLEIVLLLALITVYKYLLSNVRWAWVIQTLVMKTCKCSCKTKYIAIRDSLSHRTTYWANRELLHVSIDLDASRVTWISHLISFSEIVILSVKWTLGNNYNQKMVIRKIN